MNLFTTKYSLEVDNEVIVLLSSFDLVFVEPIFYYEYEDRNMQNFDHVKFVLILVQNLPYQSEVIDSQNKIKQKIIKSRISHSESIPTYTTQNMLLFYL
jgi:hypothetical protein